MYQKYISYGWGINMLFCFDNKCDINKASIPWKSISICSKTKVESKQDWQKRRGISWKPSVYGLSQH